MLSVSLTAYFLLWFYCFNVFFIIEFNSIIGLFYIYSLHCCICFLCVLSDFIWVLSLHYSIYLWILAFVCYNIIILTYLPMRVHTDFYSNQRSKPCHAWTQPSSHQIVTTYCINSNHWIATYSLCHLYVSIISCWVEFSCVSQTPAVWCTLYWHFVALRKL